MKKIISLLILSCISLVSFAATITGPDSVCVGSSITLTGTPSGGTWSASNGNATVGSAGLVTGVSAGVDTIFYFSGTTGPATHIVTVNPLPAPITGGTSGTIVCAGTIINLSDATPGGTWSSSNPSVATVGSATGVVTTLSPGTTIITYTLPTGCSVTTAITVGAAPAPITGPDSVCIAAVISEADATIGGTWSSGTPSVATIGSSTGIITGVAGGTTIITYTVSGCSVYDTITVPSPCTTGITETTVSNNSIAIFPNPAFDRLTIKIYPGAYRSFIITNEVGQVMVNAQLPSAQTTADIKSLPAGLYYISLKGASGAEVRKFVKE